MLKLWCDLPKYQKDLSQESSPLLSLHTAMSCPGLPCEKFAQSSDNQLHSACLSPVRYHRAPFVLWDKMTECGGLVSLLASRNQHVSLSHLELCKVGKWSIIPFKPWQFSWLERLGLPITARLQNVETFHCLPKQGFYGMFLKTVWERKGNWKACQGYMLCVHAVH